MQAEKIGTGSVSTITSLTPANDTGWTEAAAGAGQKTSSGIRVSHRSAMAYPPVWRGCNLIANAVANLPVEIYRREDDDRVLAKSHPVRGLIKASASPIIRARKLRQTMQAQALLFGNSYAFIERNGSTFRPESLWPLDPAGMMIRYLDGDLWYITSIGGKTHRFPSRNVFHVKGLSHNGVIGYDVVTLMADKLGIGIAAGEFGARFFGQGSNQSGILMIPGAWKDEKIRNTMSAWNQMATGITKWHKVALLQEGVKWQPTSVAPEAAQFLQTRDFEIRSTVASILGVPPHLLGDPSKASYNSLESENESFLRHSLDPWLREWEDEFNCKLLSDREQTTGSHYVEFNREASIQMLFNEKISGLAAQMETGLLSLNEARAKINLPDVGKDGEIRYRPTNWMEVGAKPVEPAPAPPKADPDEPDPDEDETETGETEPDPAENALRSAIRFEVSQAQTVERRRLSAVVKKHGWISTDQIDLVATFYVGWVSKTAAGFSSDLAAEAKTTYAATSMENLRDVIDGVGRVTEAELAELDPDRTSRGEALADAILESIIR